MKPRRTVTKEEREIEEKTRHADWLLSSGDYDPPTPVYPVRRQTAEPGQCAYCDRCVAGGETMFPAHDAYHGCESGKRNHCTCDMCW